MKRKTDNFDKFYNRKRNSAVKEELRQEKKTARKERQKAVDRHFEEKRNQRAAGASGQPGTAPNPFVERQAAASADKKFQGKDKKPFPASAASRSAGFKPDVPVKKPLPVQRALKPKESAGPVNKKPGTVPFHKKAAPVARPIKPPESKSGAVVHSTETIPLNKYIAHAGVSSRRNSATLVKEGRVTVNGKPVTDPGTRVSLSDTVKLNGKKISVSSHFVYILLNKPKDFLTTTSDPQGRKTVLQLIATATDERVYPIGRLDRNTSGVLLFTNDGDLSQKLSHPKNEVKKVYHVGLDKDLTKADFEKILQGVELEDGIARADVLAYADAKDKTQIGLEIHSGKNRVVRRIFAALGYDVRTLDRVMYAGLTKKNVPRGKWRFLTDKEIRILKYLKS